MRKVKFAGNVEDLLDDEDSDETSDEDSSDESESEESHNIADELAVIRMRLSQVREGNSNLGDKQIMKLTAKERKLSRAQRIKRIEKELEHAKSGDDDDNGYSMGMY